MNLRGVAVLVKRGCEGELLLRGSKGINMAERRLGRGLDRLITAARDDRLDLQTVEDSGKRIERVALERVDANPYQPRTEFDLEALNELVESLRHHGLMQPILVRRCEDRFQLVAGERRVRAARELGWSQIDAVVVEVDERTLLEWALVENIQREQLGPLEIAHSLRRLNDLYTLSQGELSQAVGLSRPAVSNYLRLLELPESVKAHVSRGTLSMGAARALLAIRDPGEAERCANAAIEGGWSVRRVEEEARRQGEDAPDAPKKSRPNRTPEVSELEQQLEELLGVTVQVRGTEKRGRLVLHYRGSDELDGLLRLLRERSEARSRGDDPGEGEARLTV